MNRYAMLLLVLLLSGTVSAVEPQKPATPPPQDSPAVEATEDGLIEQDDSSMSVWMEKKLEHSQAILRGLAVADFQAVSHNAQRLKLLNRVEGFVRRRNPEYRMHLHTFSRVVSEIERQAVKENIEGATLAFNQLTVSCVECHKSLRGENGDSSVSSDGVGDTDL